MFLKRLEIIGFKSFAERIGVDFVPGVTAIVGPNGSGKSNITDAIRWVLGEQSAKSLRGAKMEDVIFAGSDSRKPLNFAEVTLILDNSKGLFPLDYTEISVSRRVFRSGESVYLLNGQQCRLKDINDVFLDSGLGKEAFSIISQGRVDEILNSRPEDRRSILDEAAGVLKYRTRKQKAEYKLFETSDNLDRVLDILKELETRIEPLRIRAEAAEKHARLSEESKELDVTLLNLDARSLRLEIEAQRAEADTFQTRKEQLGIEVEKAEVASKRLKERLTLTDEELETLQQKLVEASAEAEKWEGRRLLTAEKRRNAGFQIERIQAELASKEAERTELKGKLENTRKKLAESGEAYEKVTKELDDISKILKRSVKETEKELEELKANYIDRLNEEATLRNDLKHIEERLVGERTSTEKIAEQTETLNRHLHSLSLEKDRKAKELAGHKRAKKASEADYARWTKALKEGEQALRNKQQLLQQAYNKQHEMQGRVRALESMEADFSGFYSGVKEVLVAKKSGALQGIHGAVAELINVDNNYVKAIETALGGAMQHVITASEADARKAIGYLRAKNAGRATFLPLDVMQSRKIQPSFLRKVEQHPEFIGTADDLVQAAPMHQTIKENLLGNTVVVNSLAAASQVAKMLNYRYRVVTMDGDVVNAGGSLTGGGVKGRASVFTRKAELEALKEQLGQMATSIDIATKTIGDMNMEAAELMQKAEQARQLNEKWQLEITSAEAGVRETEIAIRTTEIEIASVEMGRQGAETAEVKLSRKKTELLEKHREVKEMLATINEEVETLERFAADWRNEEATLTARLAELRESAAVLREQKGYQTNAVQEMERAELAAQQKIAALNEEMSYFVGHDDGKDLSVEEIAEQITQASSQKKEAEHAILKGREQRARQAGELEIQEKMLIELRADTVEMNAKQNEVAVGLSRLEVTYEAIIQKLFNEYGLRPDFQIPDGLDEKAAREKLLELKQELTALGPVNPSAIEEYKEVAERHEFLTMQRNDLLEAKSTLQEAMSEMDAEMTARFSTTFNAVQSQFRRVFKEMFGGGDADLILTDPNNLLETGIDIVARPPGKKLQNLSLLSGGERALTAISLLFSIIQVRPVPFCILDEVEAALDEANVIRYSKYLQAFSERTQFIVITHRKGTMEGADVLYGITMQESGVSRLISVKLSEVPEEAIS